MVDPLLGGNMNHLLVKQNFRIAAISIALIVTASATAQNLTGVSTFATGAAVSATQPDSIALGNGSVWVSYSNGADSTGLGGSSTVVHYKLEDGKVRKVYSIPGSVDGLKLDPRTGLVWALQNQDGNSTLTLINPKTGITTNSPIPYAVKSGARGADGQLIFVAQPGTKKQSVSFLTVLDPKSGLHVSELDDTVFATAEKGSFYLADTNNNRVLTIDAEDFTVGSLYASVGSLNELAKVDMSTGRVTALVRNLSGPHGLAFLPHNDDDGENDN
jgi:DNA-binding beta-propeller fold protein YncE